MAMLSASHDPQPRTGVADRFSKANNDVEYMEEESESFQGPSLGEGALEYFNRNIKVPNEKFPSMGEFRRAFDQFMDLRRTFAKDAWEYDDNNDFTESFFERITQTHVLPPYRSASNLCERCSNIDLSHSITLSSLQATTKTCELCRLLGQRLEQFAETEVIPLEGRSIVSICAGWGTANPDEGIPVGFPDLPGDPIRIELLRAWLQVCDHNHSKYACRPESPDPPPLPTRVLDVGDGTDPSHLRLHQSKGGEKGEYLALSHCWGNPTKEEKDEFSTFRENLDVRYAGISLRKLPQTFQDAVRVTRELGKRYLWIDSLCIIQGPDGDWESESRRMEHVFGNAYCTIAASSARDSTVGFLRLRESARNYVKVPNSSHGPVFICEAIDDFDRDVGDSVLNRRAWVLQERALSRRTIHFTACQTYWECGAGVHCETLTRMHSLNSLFMGDPKFPSSLLHRSTESRIALFQSLFVKYSQLGLTKNTDRPVAISSLEKRLATTFETEVRYGVFAKYFHRSLFWQRSGDTRMKRIPYRNRSVPSWSWMAYDGRIDYKSIGFQQVKWSRDVQWPEFILDAKVRDFQDCKIERKDDEECVIEDKIGSGERGWLVFDGDDRTDVQTLKCVIIGRESSEGARRELSGSEDSESEGVWSEYAGSEDTESENSGSEDAGIEDTESEDAGSEDDGSEGTGSEDAGSEDTGSEGDGSGDAESEDAESEDAKSEDAESEDAKSEDVESEDAGSPDAERKLYILVVGPICSDGCRDFERVGVGSVPQSFISFESGDIKGRIL